LRYVFNGAPQALFSSDDGYIPFRSDMKGASVDLTAGVDGQITRGLTAYASGFYLWRLENLGSSYGAKAGLRLAW
jgi:hypothetical protein